MMCPLWSLGLFCWLPRGLCHSCPQATHSARGPAYLQGQLVSKEGADEVAGVSANPAQEEPQRQGLVHVARFAGLDVLAVDKEEEMPRERLRAVMPPRSVKEGTGPGRDSHGNHLGGSPS